MIFLVRHGEAAASWGDHPDPGLSELGHRQAAAVAQQLQQLGAVRAVCSPMQRCRETARPFELLTGMAATVEPVVSEIGTPDGVTDRVAWLRGFMAGSWLDEGRFHAGWRDRIAGVVLDLVPFTAVFSHYVAINAAVSAITGDPRTTVFKPGHCSITQIETGPGGARVIEYGSQAATRVL